MLPVSRAVLREGIPLATDRVLLPELEALKVLLVARTLLLRELPLELPPVNDLEAMLREFSDTPLPERDLERVSLPLKPL